ncbi:hypothetical protein MASR2M18_03060 [Ignavibacteria bacterium]
MARIRQGYSPDALLQTLPQAKIRAMLTPDLSLTFNPKVAARHIAATMQHLDAIRLAEEPILRTFSIYYESKESPIAVCKRLMDNPAVEIAEPKYIEHTFGLPNDPELSKQAYLNVIRALEAWNIFPGDTNIVIGICDNGVYKIHEDLTGNIARNWSEIPGNGKDDDGNGYADDYDGVNLASFTDDGTKPGDTYVLDSHGTDVAGLAGATVNNSVGIAGSGGRCRIFPIKAGMRSKSGIYFGYEGIIYAATRGFAVINCSWGTTNAYSKLNESFINFAVTRGTAVVAAAGNEQITAPMYPAAYRGVLGVGATDVGDNIASYSAIGFHVRIMSPGHNAYTTNNSNSYDVFSGTSAASPIAAAHVALIRAKYPALNALQAVEFARICGDDISSSNEYWAKMIPLRLNMLKAMQHYPLSKPAISLIEQIYEVNGTTPARFFAGDTVKMTARVKNYLGDAQNARFELSQPDISQPLILLDSVVDNVSIGSGATADIGQFRFIINERGTSPVILRMDIEANDDYQDFFLFPITATSDIETFQNNTIALDAADNGSIGFAGEGSSLRGGGLLLKPYQNVLPATAYSGYSTALIATANNQKTMVAFPAWSDFGARKLLVAPDRNISVLIDSAGDFPEKRIGLLLQVKYLPDSNSLPAIKIALKATNTNDSAIDNLALGYYFDFDIGRYGLDNQTRLYPEGLEGVKGTAVAMTAFRTGDYPFVGIAAQSYETDAVPQAAGLNRNDIFESDYRSDLYNTINNGTLLQFNGTNDIAAAVGMKFAGVTAPGESRECNVCIAASMNESDMRNALRRCLGAEVVGIGNDCILEKCGGAAELSVAPLPVEETARFEGKFSVAKPSKIMAKLFDGLGRLIRVFDVFSDDSGHVTGTLDAINIPNGIYRLAIASGTETMSAAIIISR